MKNDKTDICWFFSARGIWLPSLKLCIPNPQPSHPKNTNVTVKAKYQGKSFHIENKIRDFVI